MKKIAIVFLNISIIIFLVGCGKSKSEICLPPENPYDEGSGHYAGFEWAQENDSGCDGNSESFNEGCGEYYTQRDQYDACLKQK